jgi:hypothetical protein
MSDKVLKAAIKIVNATGTYPTSTSLESAGITRGVLRQEFGNLAALNRHLAQICDNIFDLELNTVNTSVPNKSRFIITSAVTGSKVHKGFLAAINTYCKKENAGLIVMPTKSTTQSRWVIDPSLRGECFVMDDVQLNSNLKLLGLITAAKSVDPTTGLPRIGQRNGTFITASPKQRLKFVATGLNKLPHALMSTGAITAPNYATASILNNKSEYIAENDHVMGGIIVELDDNDAFHFRQIQADASGNFVDLGTLYGKNGTKSMAPSAFILGDWHSGETDAIAATAFLNLSKKLKVDTLVMHDVFSGISVNHHAVHRKIEQAKLASEGKLDLKSELQGLAADLNKIQDYAKNVVVVKSNHEEFLERYLQEARYVDDPHNHRLALELAAAYFDGSNPVQYYVEKLSGVKTKARWLKRDEDYSVAGIHLGNHGDLGANGARGSATSLEAAHTNVVYGHSHTPEILRGAWCVGTTSLLTLSYNRGPSSWFHTSCLVYPNGMRQLVNCVDGKLTTKL